MYLGLDLGTSALKALVADINGNIIKEASASYLVKYVLNNGTEQDPKDWLLALDKVLKDLKPYLSEVRALAISGQMHGLVMLDKNDEVIRPCILWNDGRTVKENNYLNERKEEIYRNTSNISYAGFTLPKLLWVYQNERANFNKIAKVMLPKDYLVYYLTGNFVSDYTDMAGTLLLDVKNRCYSEAQIKLTRLSLKNLPKLHESYDVVGYVKEDLALKYGFTKTKVMAGGADNALAALATNTISPGSSNISLGTSGTILMPIKEIKPLNSYGLHIFSHIKDSYIMGCILSAASSRKWFLEEILETKDYNKNEEEMSSANTNNLYFLPYLQGERSPHNDPLAKGAFVGLTSTTTRGAMSKAILEGVSFALRDSLEIVKKAGYEINTLSLCGGGAKSKLWCQIISNVMKMDVKTLENEQGPAYGAILLAMIGDKKIALEDISHYVKFASTYHPENTSYYDAKYQKFTRLYPALKSVFKDN